MSELAYSVVPPVTEPPGENPPAGDPTADAAGEKPARVLIVDDQETVRFLASEALAQAGFQVTEAENGLEALESCQADLPDIVLMDVMMPELDGFETCTALRENEITRHLPVIMMTGTDDDDSINRAYECGATDFIAKPFKNQILCHRLRYILRAQRFADELRESRTTLVQAQRIAKLGNWRWAVGSPAMSWSEEAARVLGLAPVAAKLVPEDILLLTHSEDRGPLEVWFDQAGKNPDLPGVGFRVVDTDGKERRIQQQVIAQPGADGNPAVLFGTVQDVTELEAAQEKIRELAFYDRLTGLPNRELFRQTMSRVLALVQRYDRCAAVLFIDLDDFKRVNDTLGHTIGDQLLQGVAQRLIESLRESDLVVRGGPEHEPELVARLGGDEFTIVLSEVAQPDDARRVAERIIEVLATPFELSGHEIFISPSIGISLLPRDASDAESALRTADLAMYHAKRDGKNHFKYFDESMNTASMERLQLEGELRRALDRDELFLEFQPQLNLQTEQICGLEALIRWQNPKLGMVRPDRFISVAEDTGLIIPIGEWVLRTACVQGKLWTDQGICPPRIGVNVSIVQLMQSNFVELVTAILDETGFDPTALELEITESTLMQDPTSTIEVLSSLKALGLQLAIDDFGIGYSSLGQLKDFPVDRVKIDRSFVRDITIDVNDHAIAVAVIRMAETLNLATIAEGVEEADQKKLLADEQCQEMQGFHFSRPLSAARIEALLRERAGLD